jgi:hypothetical protein
MPRSKGTRWIFRAALLLIALAFILLLIKGSGKACVASVPAVQQIQLKPGEHTDTWKGGIMAGDAKGRSYDVITTLIAQGNWTSWQP